MQHTIEKFNANLKADEKILFEKYARQYVGSKTPSGDIVVYTYCLCAPEKFKNKDKELAIGFDGGICFFECKIDLDEKKVYDFITNGVA